MSEWVMIGVPSSAGAHHAGQELAPAALRSADLADRLAAAGVTDAGDLAGAVFAPDPSAMAGRNLAAVARVADEVADAIAEVVASGRLPLVLGGDCTITIGAVAGFKRSRPEVGLVYVDGDADLGVPGDGGSGIFDSMGITHLLGGGAAELARLGGPGPLLTAARLAIVGSDPRETTQAQRDYLNEEKVSFTEAPAFIKDPAGAARRALAAVHDSRGAPARDVLVHFDIDVVDSADLPLGNFPHYGSGVTLQDALACIAELRANPAFAGLVLTEINPTHDPSGAELRRLVDGLAPALAG
jgi:arginase